MIQVLSQIWTPPVTRLALHSPGQPRLNRALSPAVGCRGWSWEPGAGDGQLEVARRWPWGLSGVGGGVADNFVD